MLVRNRSLMLCLGGLVVACGTNGRGDDGGGGDKVTVTAPFAPDAVIAYRDGDGPWTVKKASGGPITFTVGSGSYTVAVGCNSTIQRVDVYQLTTAELTELEVAAPCEQWNTPLSVSVANASTNTQIGWGLDEETNYATQAMYMFDVGTRPHDLVITTGPTVAVFDHMVIKRDFSATATPSVAIDFADPSVIALAPTGISVNGASYTRILEFGFVTAGGTVVSLGYNNLSYTMSVPAAAMMPGDLHVVRASRPGAVQGQVIGALRASHDPPTTLTFPMVSTDAPVLTGTRTGTDLTSVRAQWTSQTGVAAYRLSASEGEHHVYASPMAFDATGALELPDLSTVPGWDASLVAFPAPTYWSIEALTGADLPQLLRPLPSVDAEIRTSGWQFGL